MYLWLLMLLLVVPSSFTLGWLAYRSICMLQEGCPKWQRKNTREWTKELGSHYTDEQHSHHPTREVDSKDSEGVPSIRQDEPTADT